MGLRLLYVTTRVQKVRFKRKKPRDHEENKSKKYSVIKYKGLEEKMSLLVFFSEKVFLMKCNNMPPGRGSYERKIKTFIFC